MKRKKNEVFLEEGAKRDIIIFAQYLMIYVILQYTFNYIFASISYFGKFYKWRSLYSLGLFPIGKIVIDWAIPVSFAFYVLYTINQSDVCNGCMMGQEDRIATDFTEFWNWSLAYLVEKKEIIYVHINPVVDIYVDQIFPSAASTVVEIRNVIWEFAELLLSPFLSIVWTSVTNTFLASTSLISDLTKILTSVTLDLQGTKEIEQAMPPAKNLSLHLDLAPGGPPSVDTPLENQDESLGKGFLCSYLGWAVSWSNACLAP